MNVLVTGGAGYIGSHMVLALIDRGQTVVVLDNLTTGVRENVSKSALFVEGNCGDPNTVEAVLSQNKIDGVMHFAGSVIVPESVNDPLAYYANNTIASHNLIKKCVQFGIQNFVFSSTAAVYGATGDLPVSEEAATAPINPYGRSKLMTEWMLRDTAAASDFRFTALRYFNVAGADRKGRSGQSTPCATHLIKRACEVALGKKPHLEIFGCDFPTPDGTGVRDYIDINDLISAHLLAFAELLKGGNRGIYNCGYGHGTSVAEIIKVVETVSGKSLPITRAPRRAGDPAIVIADPSKIKHDLSWVPHYDSLRETIASAFEWEKTTTQTVIFAPL